MEKVIVPAHMRMVELPLESVKLDLSLLTRRYSDEQVDIAVAYFGRLPMMHPPVVTKLDGECVLAAGQMRFRVLMRECQPSGPAWFRWVDVKDRNDVRRIGELENLQARLIGDAFETAVPWRRRS